MVTSEAQWLGHYSLEVQANSALPEAALVEQAAQHSQQSAGPLSPRKQAILEFARTQSSTHHLPFQTSKQGVLSLGFPCLKHFLVPLMLLPLPPFPLAQGSSATVLEPLWAANALLGVLSRAPPPQL